MDNLHLTLIQSNLYWESPDANLAMFEEKIWQFDKTGDLIILPEMFNSGFTMNAEAMGEPMNYKTFRWMKQMSKQTGSVITGSFIVKEGQKYFNRLIWMQPDGNYDFYDKRHLFRMAGEHNTFSPGSNKLVKTIKGWKVALFICYDLRFPVWSRNKNNEYDLAIYIANWPTARSIAWKKLLPARAIENLCYVAGVNRIGTDNNSISYSGDSGIFDFKGENLVNLYEKETSATFTLEKDKLISFRKEFPANQDADDFFINI